MKYTASYSNNPRAQEKRKLAEKKTSLLNLPGSEMTEDNFRHTALLQSLKNDS